MALEASALFTGKSEVVAMTAGAGVAPPSMAGESMAVAGSKGVGVSMRSARTALAADGGATVETLGGRSVAVGCEVAALVATPCNERIGAASIGATRRS